MQWQIIKVQSLHFHHNLKMSAQKTAMDKHGSVGNTKCVALKWADGWGFLFRDYMSVSHQPMNISLGPAPWWSKHTWRKRLKQTHVEIRDKKEQFNCIKLTTRLIAPKKRQHVDPLKTRERQLSKTLPVSRNTVKHMAAVVRKPKKYVSFFVRFAFFSSFF